MFEEWNAPSQGVRSKATPVRALAMSSAFTEPMLAAPHNPRMRHAEKDVYCTLVLVCRNPV